MERFLLRVQNRKLPANLKFGPVKLIKRVNERKQNLHPWVKVDQAARPLPSKNT